MGGIHSWFLLKIIEDRLEFISTNAAFRFYRLMNISRRTYDDLKHKNVRFFIYMSVKTYLLSLYFFPVKLDGLNRGARKSPVIPRVNLEISRRRVHHTECSIPGTPESPSQSPAIRTRGSINALDATAED